jgi:hypothetical protein
MPRSKAELALRVAQELRIVGAGEALDAASQADILRDYESMLEVLERRGIAAWPDDAANVQSIPNWAFVPLAVYMAAVVAPIFGRDYMAPEMAIAELLRATAGAYSGQTMAGSTF